MADIIRVVIAPDANPHGCLFEREIGYAVAAEGPDKHLVADLQPDRCVTEFGVSRLVASGVSFIAAVSHRSIRYDWVQRVAWL